MNKTSLLLQEKFRNAFKKAKRPRIDDIVECDCWECADIQEAFKDQVSENLQEDIIVNNLTLSLFSPRAFHYFLPGYIIFFLKNESFLYQVGQSILLALLPGKEDDASKSYWCDRVKLFSVEQMEALYEFIDYMKNKPEILRDQTLIERGEKRLKRYYSICASGR